jgi:hypothetical protein
MSGYSDEPTGTLTAVTPRQILTLLEVLQGTTWRNRLFVEARYNERARNFSETLAFLEDLGWVQGLGEELCAKGETIARITQAGQADMCRALADALADSRGPHQKIVADYLTRFQSDEGMLVYRPVEEQRLKESPVRNFLMELGAVAYRSDPDRYVLNEAFAPLYLWARNIMGATDEAALMERVKDRQRLGRAAELAVVAFEKERLGSRWAERVQHVAAEYPASCYDIKSVTVQGEVVSPRFIEVKAVPADTFQFYWTASELEAARLLGANLFLYLLPVQGHATFDLARLEIVPNPYATVYQNPAAWSKDESVIVCHRRSKIMTT